MKNKTSAGWPQSHAGWGTVNIGAPHFITLWLSLSSQIVECHSFKLCEKSHFGPEQWPRQTYKTWWWWCGVASGFLSGLNWYPDCWWIEVGMEPVRRWKAMRLWKCSKLKPGLEMAKRKIPTLNPEFYIGKVSLLSIIELWEYISMEYWVSGT